jgi:hypothetical protein
LGADFGPGEGSRRAAAGAGVLLYTDGLTEARHEREQFGLDGVSALMAWERNRSRPTHTAMPSKTTIPARE